MLKFFVLTLALPLVMFLFPFDSDDNKPPSPFVFNADEGILTLRGNWKFQTGDDPRWRRPDFPDADWRTMPVPGRWANNKAQNLGIAWYRAWIEIPSQVDTSTEWAIKIDQLHLAGEVYWDGQLVAQHGKVGNSEASEVPGPNNYLYAMAKAQSSGRHLLALRVSNFHSPTGGILRPPELGSYQALLAHHTNLKMLFGFYTGLFFLSGVYHLVLFIYHRSRREYLLFALLSLTLAVPLLLEELPIHFGIKIHYLSWAGAIFLLYRFLIEQFEYRNRWLDKLIVAATILLAMPVLLPNGLIIISRLIPLRNFWIQIILLVAVYIIFWAVRHQRPGSRILAFGVLPLAVGGIYYLRTFENVWGLTSFALFAVMMAVSLAKKMAVIENEVRSTRDVFGLFVPEPVLDKIAKEGLNSIKLGGAEEGIATILFTDIRSFSAIAEQLSPNETLAFLNEFMTRMQPVIHANGGFIGGFINQFVGDEIMAIFYKSGHSDDAIQTAIAMREALKEHNRERMLSGELPIDIGVGVNTGKVIWGTIGSEVRMESAIIGDTVNLASRLQGLTKRYGAGVLVSESAYREIPHPEKYCCRQVDVVQVKGKTQPVSASMKFLTRMPSRSRRKSCKDWQRIIRL
jgi:adenylate cyclase